MACFNKIKHNGFKWELISDAKLCGIYDMPELKPVLDAHFTNMIPFNSMSKHKVFKDSCVHFYLDDYRIERFWRGPENYIRAIKRFDVAISPDFSMLLDMPLAQQMWNCWRNKVLAYYMQKCGIITIPNVGWGSTESLDWAFDGIPEHSILAVTSQGCMKKEDYLCKQTFLNGLHELMRRKSPIKLLVYETFPEEWKIRFPIPIIVIEPFSASFRTKRRIAKNIPATARIDFTIPITF